MSSKGSNVNLKEKAKELVYKDLLAKLKKGDKEAEAELLKLVAKEVDSSWPMQPIYLTKPWESPLYGGSPYWRTTICASTLTSTNDTTLEIT